MNMFSRMAVLTVALSLWATAPSAAQPGPAYFQQQQLDQDHGKVAVADINGDGHGDVIRRTGETLAWFEHTDDGTLRKHEIAGGFTFQGDRIAARDVDDDGDTDVVTTIDEGSEDDDRYTVAWIENPRPESEPSAPWSMHRIGEQQGYAKNVTAADLDGDGRLDVVTRAHKQTALYFQRATPTEWSLEKTLQHESHEGLGLGDLDQDGDPDIVLNGFWFETPEGARAGSYQRHVIDEKWFTPVDNSWRDNNVVARVADANGDEMPDVLMSHSELPGFPISLYTASSPEAAKEGDWTETQVAEEFDFAQTLEVGDVDLDGNLDVVAAKFRRNPDEGQQWMNESPFPVVVFYNEGTGAGAWTPDTLSEEGIYSGALGDVGGDGDLDMVGGRSYWTGPTIMWENQLRDGEQAADSSAGAGSASDGASSGPGGRELPLDEWNYIQVDDDRTPYPGKSGDAAGWWFGLAMGDLTGDDYKDIASGKWFYRNPGGDMTGTWERTATSDSLDNLLIADVDGDEQGDIIAAKCGRQYWLEAEDQQGTDWQRTQIGTLPVCNHDISSQGYNQAQLVEGGKPELLLAGDGIYYMEIPMEIPEDASSESGAWPTQTITGGGNNGEWVAPADMDGDGDLDVTGAYDVPESQAGGEGDQAIGIGWWENPGDGSGNWSRHDVGTSRFRADKVLGGDLNGDGRPDLVVTEERYPGKNPDASMYWFEAPADPTEGGWESHQIVEQYSMNNLDVADMDQDGDTDIVTGEHKGPNEAVQIWENDGDANFTKHVVDRGKESHLGTRTADLDGDGDRDIVSIAWVDYQNLHVWRNDATRGSEEVGSATSAMQSSQTDEEVAQTPPMGWNSWNHFGCDINAEIIRETIDAIVESGMADAGYEYVNIDDCWMASERGPEGRLQPHPERFPNGIEPLADYAHSKGLKLGLYESAGTETCQGFPGSLGYEEKDAEAFAEWGVDYLKYDNCGDHRGLSARERYRRMHEALEAATAETGRPIVYSVCEWGKNQPWNWAAEVGGNLWRTTGDIGPCFEQPCGEDVWSRAHSVLQILDKQVGLAEHAGPGHWNDPDMLEVGNEGLSYTEAKAHFSLWAMLAAPLLAGNDLRAMSDSTRRLLTNEEIIAVNQDPLGRQGTKIKDESNLEVWVKPLEGGARAVLLLNRWEQPARIETTAREIGLAEASSYEMRDLWARETRTSETAGRIAAEVPPHGVVMLRVQAASGQAAASPRGPSGQ